MTLSAPPLGNLGTGWARPWGNPQTIHGLPGIRRKWFTSSRKWKRNPNRESWTCTQCKRDASLVLGWATFFIKAGHVEAAPSGQDPLRKSWASSSSETQPGLGTHTSNLSPLLSCTGPKERGEKRKRNPKTVPKICFDLCWHYVTFSDGSGCNVDHGPREEGSGTTH